MQVNRAFAVGRSLGFSSFNRRVLPVALAILVLMLGHPSFAAAPAAVPSGAQNARCDRACLLGIVSDYLDALEKHDPDGLPVAADVRVTENGKIVKLGEGIWKTVSSFSYRQSFVDPVSGQAGFYGVAREDKDTADIFALRIKVRNRKIAEVETLVARPGSHPIFNPDGILTPKAVFNDAVPESERSSRQQLIAAANSYFDGIEQHKPEIIPFHPDCNRTENGIQTTNNPPRFPSDCRESIAGVSYISRVRDRRFPVVDETRGLVWAIVLFDIPGNLESLPPTSDKQIQAKLREPRSLLLFELFKVESGKIAEIEAFMSNVPLGGSGGW